MILTSQVENRKEKIMMNEDIKIKCQDCNNEFVFTASEQKFYNEKNLVPPKRCKKCRDARKKYLKF